MYVFAKSENYSFIILNIDLGGDAVAAAKYPRTFARGYALAAGMLSLFFFLFLVCISVSWHQNEDQLQMEYIAQTVESETYETLLTQMSKTLVQEAYLIETGGNYERFGLVVERLFQDHTVRNLMFAPEGIVRGVFPLEGNETVIGLDLNSDGQGNLEAQAAIEKAALFLAGPFELIQGGMGISGRLPVYLENSQGQQEYWGLVSVTLNYPAIFENNPIYRVNEQGYACRVYRINPDDHQEQTIMESPIPIGKRAPVYEQTIKMFNAEWIIAVAPLRMWYQQLGFWMLMLGGLLVSVLVSYLVATTRRLREMKESEDKLRIQALQQKLEWEETNTLLGQISSHFFYHTLNSLQALIVLQPDAAYKMAGDFSRYLRFNVDAVTATGGVVPFREELRSIKAYAEINEAQLGDRLKVVFDVPDVDFPIPALTIQPVVENAILHGIKPKLGGGVVTVRVTEDDSHWHVLIQDNGMGFSPDAQDRERSVGLPNVRKRMSRFTGCGITIGSREGEGTAVTLHYSKDLQNNGR